MLKDKSKKFNLHSFGYNDDVDLQIAKEISEKLALKCSYLQPLELGKGHLLKMSEEYVTAAQLAEPASSYLKLNVFNHLYFEDKFLIDGALAEFARRQFLNRLLIKGKNALLKKNYKEVLNHLMVPKPKLFTVEYEEMMLENAVAQLKKVFEEFPDAAETGVENFVDLLVVKYRIPNYFGPEQARLDSLFPGFMPFAQQTVITASLGIPVNERKDSRLFYNAIHENYPELEEFSLVKNSMKYPYGLSALSSYAYTKVKKSFRKNPSDITRINFFKMHEQAIREIVTRDVIREYAPYDEEFVISIINDFYEGKENRLNDLDWLLSFEMFRRSLHITS